MSVAARIEEILKARNFSTRELDRRSKISEGTTAQLLRRMKSNSAASVTLSTLEAIARGAHVNSRWLLTGEGSPDDFDESNAAPEEPIRSQLPDPSVAAPRWKNYPGYYEMAATALQLDAGIPAWTVDVLAEASPMIIGTITPAVIADLLRVVVKHVPPPRERSK